MRKDTPSPKGFLSRLGPGLITGAADDDPSGIGTHSEVGAQFGYGLAWTFVFSFPLMVVIQEVAAQIGRVTGRGIAANVRRHYPRGLLFLIVSLLLVANVINLGADLSAMGAALQLLTGGKGITDIQTSSQAAEALRPIAGDLAFALFALGIIGTGMLAVPVLAGSAAYAITEMMGRTGSLASKPLQAKFFCGAIAATTLVGGMVNMGGLDPAKALYWAAVVNGVLAAPLMAVMMLIVRNEKAMGKLVLPHRATLWGWAATAVMAAATAVFFWFLFTGG